MQIFRPLKWKKTEQFQERTFAQDAYAATKSTALSKDHEIKTCRFCRFFILCSSAVKQLETAEDHQTSENDQPQLGRKQKCTDRTNPDDQQNQSEQLYLAGSPAAWLFKFKRQCDHFLIKHQICKGQHENHENDIPNENWDGMYDQHRTGNRHDNAYQSENQPFFSQRRPPITILCFSRGDRAKIISHLPQNMVK